MQFVYELFHFILPFSLQQITTRSPAIDSFDAPYYNSEKGRPRQHQYNYLRLIWEERGAVLEYSLRYNTTRRGFWISSPPLPGMNVTFYFVK